MLTEKQTQIEIGGYISSVLRDNFGKGPTSVYVTIKRPFILIHFRGFLAPMEAVLLKQDKWKRILETRDLLMNDLSSEIRENIKNIADLPIQKIYADWDLKKKTGVIIGTMNEETDETSFDWPEEVDKAEFKHAIEKASEKAEKFPRQTDSYWLNDRAILIKRTGILVEIEKELIKTGLEESLKLAKRPLEHRLINLSQLNKILNREVNEMFFDWNFAEDIGYTVIFLKPKN